VSLDWSMRSDAGTLVVGTCGFSSQSRVTEKVSKQEEGKIKNFKLN